MSAEFVRDAVATTAILGFFASAWFGWAQEDPPPRWRTPLVVGSVLSLTTAAVGGFLVWQNWSSGSAIDATSGPIFGIVVGIEVFVAASGVVFLSRRGKRDLISAWIALVVGVHFFPLAPLLAAPLLYVVASLVTAAALISIPLARSRDLAVSTVAGVTVGTVLLGTALASLLL